MSDPTAPLTLEGAAAIYDVLIAHAGASSQADVRADFIGSQTRRPISEYRFIGSLGFGGKFWRDHGRRPDGTWGEVWRVSAYPEDTTPERKAAIAATNDALEELRARRA